MAYLLDTSILGRLANRADTAHLVAVAAIAELHRRGEVLHMTAQNLIEFRNFATRPVTSNGLGLDSPSAENLATVFESTFSLLEENADIFPTWKAIVTTLGVLGKQVHDARLVAVCHVHGVTNLLTFNVAHFARLGTFAPGLAIVDPAAV